MEFSPAGLGVTLTIGRVQSRRQHPGANGACMGAPRPASRNPGSATAGTLTRAR